MIWTILVQVEYGPAAEDWKQYRHDYRRTGRTPLRAICSSPSELYDAVHGTLDLSIVATRVNGGNDHDIIAAERNDDGVAAKDGATGSHIWDDVLDDDFTSPGIASVALSNQYVFANGYYYFAVFRLTNGTLVYAYDKPDGRGPSPLIADINSDGCPEVFTSFNNQAVSINGCATAYTTNWTYTLPASAFAPALLRMGTSWFVAYPASNGYVYVLNAATGALHGSFYASVPSSIVSYPDYTISTGNLEGLGDDEIVVPTSSGVTVYRWTGSSWATLWSVSGLSNVSPVALGDKDGDGLEDVWVVAGGELRVYKGNNGTLLGQTSGLGVYSRYGYAHAPTLFDFNGDGRLDALVAHSGDSVRAVNGATMSIIGTFGDTPYDITSEIIVIKLSTMEAGFSVGDYSCWITTWGRCVLGYDDGTAVYERENKGYYEVMKDGIRVISEGVDVLVYSIWGKQIRRYRVEGEKFLDLSDLPKGVYIARIGKETLRFIRM